MGKIWLISFLINLWDIIGYEDMKPNKVPKVLEIRFDEINKPWEEVIKDGTKKIYMYILINLSLKSLKKIFKVHLIIFDLVNSPSCIIKKIIYYYRYLINSKSSYKTLVNNNTTNYFRLGLSPYSIKNF